jgi:arylformamidase
VSRFVELSHPVTAGMTTYPGLPGPDLSDHLSFVESRGRFAPGTEFRIGRISLVGNTGTYLDAPAHRFAAAGDLATIGLEKLADLPGLRVDADDRGVDAARLSTVVGDRDLTGTAVLVRTGWDRHWGTTAYGGAAAPYLTADAADWLVARGPALVGIDSVNIDDIADLARPAHTGLLRAGILIVEHLTDLDRLPASGFRFFATPPLLAGVPSFPVRAFAITD